MVSEETQPRPEQRLQRVRFVTLVSLTITAWTSLIMPGVGLFRETRELWIWLGGLGILLFAVGQSGVLYAAVTPWLTSRSRGRLFWAFGATVVASIGLAGPLAAGRWATWAWFGASIVGTAPLLFRRWRLVAACFATLAVAVGVAVWTGGSVRDSLIIAGGIGAGVAAFNALQVWFWDLLVQAEQGRRAQAQLAAAEERLRFARDVHDLLGHNLSVIALKAELAARLAPVDAARAGREAADVQHLAASALTELREVVHGYRTISLREQLAAVQEILRSSGVRCTVAEPEAEPPPELAAQLVPVLREASTNVLRHSRASWCTIDVAWDQGEVRMTVANDGVTSAGPDRYSSGLRGLADRLAEAGGVLRTRSEDGVFTLEATARPVMAR
ncbi:sensor histidine kinase [Flindersiella endophytica]